MTIHLAIHRYQVYLIRTSSKDIGKYVASVVTDKSILYVPCLACPISVSQPFSFRDKLQLVHRHSFHASLRVGFKYRHDTKISA